MAAITLSNSTPRCVKLSITGQSSYYTKMTSWKKTISNGRIITLTIHNDYEDANAYIYTTPETASNIVSLCSRLNFIELDSYDGDIEVYTKPCKQFMTVDEVDLNIEKLVNSGKFTREEAKEIYRTALKWDIVFRDKSSDSESFSDSDCDTKKLQKHAWKFCAEKNIIKGQFHIYDKY
tara:strand:- start:523 stop:1056 length:534 start_codon:yes stop_codon:yes gene_type:complete